MERKESCRRCWNCGNFRAFYTKGYCYFDKTKQGLCSRHGEIKDKQDACGFWRDSFKITETRKKICRKALTDIVVNLSAIRQILQEEQEDEAEK